MNMSVRQKFLRFVYPLLMEWVRISGRHAKWIQNINNSRPVVSFYALKAIANDGSVIDFSVFKGKMVLLVNTASDCGYTGQYAQLEKLYRENRDKLVVIGFPANDFKKQEKGSDEEIGAFCKTNYGISFLLSKKTVVVKKQGQHPVFQWLTYADRNGWLDKAPDWNFAKYLVTTEGVLDSYFGPGISPLDEVVLKAINSHKLKGFGPQETP
jgi:glutathione peroxidase